MDEATSLSDPSPTLESSTSDSIFQELGPEGCQSVWQKLCASDNGRLLKGIEVESFASVLITYHDHLFTGSEKDKLNSKERNWRVCKEMVQESLERDPVNVLWAFYKALIATQSSDGAAQHSAIAKKMTKIASDVKAKDDHKLPLGTIDTCEDRPGSPLSSTGCSSSHSTPLSMSPRRQEDDVPVAVNVVTQPSVPVKLLPMPINLQVISCALLNNNIYVIGIATKEQEGSSQVQVYSLVEGKWYMLPEAPNHNAPIVVVNDHITLIGGRAAGKKLTSILSTWSEKGGKWKEKISPMPSSRVASGICYHDDFLLVTGGAEESRMEGVKFEVFDSVYVYNFSTMQWRVLQALQLPVALRSHHLVLWGDYIYLVGGALTFPIQKEDGKTPFNSKAWRAKWSDVKEAISTQHLQVGIRNVWSRIADPPIVCPIAVSCNDSLLLVGGRGLKDDSPQKAIYKFVDVKDGNSWIMVGSMSVGRYRHAVVPVGNSGTALFVAGGFVKGNPSEDEVDEKSTSAELVLL